ncbi:MAG: F0F1 ATP synthase subunit A [Bacteroidetes bacterium]|nr:F0F1 ATP synthase subunit A [Bacteroidota bacterium]
MLLAKSPIKSLILVLFFTLVSAFSEKLTASSQNDTALADTIEKEVDIDITEVAFEHILDAHSWHIFGEGHHAVSIPLPVILETNNGITVFSSSEFNHDIKGKIVVEKNGERFVNYKEKIYYASDSANQNGQYLTAKEEGKELIIENASPLDFSITKNVASMFISVIIILWLGISLARAYKKTGITSAPKGKQSFLEPLIVFVRDDIAKSNIGTRGEKFAPFLLTIFFFILINNILGMLPFGANLTGNIAFTLSLSVVTLIVTNVNGNAAYWHHIFAPPAPWWLYLILIPIEIIGIFTKPFALMIRLFANMSAGHIIIVSLVGLIFIFKTLLVSPVSVAFALFIDVLECLVALLQAYIFTMLTALFIGTATADHHEHEHRDEEQHEGETLSTQNH